VVTDSDKDGNARGVGIETDDVPCEVKTVGAKVMKTIVYRAGDVLVEEIGGRRFEGRPAMTEVKK
jgi:hypothetical protein